MNIVGLQLALLLVVLFHPATLAGETDRLSYARDIQPILSANCFPCHGPDATQRQAGLRLDLPQAGQSSTDSGLPAIAPCSPEESELVARINAQDPTAMMPPVKFNRSLTDVQKSLLARWITQGAAYESHWAYIPPICLAEPQVTKLTWPRNAIDRFVLARLEREGIVPSPMADRSTLIRRASLDLTGLPPTRAETEAFLLDNSADAYEKVVDRLLASPHYGERMAVDWLDAARYADTNGYQVDRDRQQHHYRDWVINAFNRNLPFDQFTIEQLAGDLLPEPTREQLIATGFNRNHMVNEEIGVIPEEFIAEYLADRVETTASVWLGQTFNCARCHDHKFDPITQRDFYSLKAFFSIAQEQGLARWDLPISINNSPYLRLSTQVQEASLKELQEKVALAEARHDKQLAEQEKTSDTAPAPTESAEALAKLKAELIELEASIPTSLIMAEPAESCRTFILQRGAYDQPGAEVTANTPTFLPAMPEPLPRNRLGLATWLVSPQNPLTARVTINRLWQSLFGTGLVASSGDFGSQGALPSHPELLDWLAVEFRETGWDVKRMLKLFVMSATYQQSSSISPALLVRDPGNELLARAPRLRLQAEFLRDQALAASGLLVRRIGGPSVKPYHPSGLYEQVVAVVLVDQTYQPGTGDDLHRRSLYTYWKRSVPHPAMLAFDAPFREGCTVRRSRTNTAMQALNLMNDPTYLEAAKFLAARMIQEGGADAGDRIAHGFWLVLARSPRAEEKTLLIQALDRFRSEFAATPASSKELLGIGARLPDTLAEESDLAAYTLMASMILCCDEAVMKN
jgi:hypothetical protein